MAERAFGDHVERLFGMDATSTALAVLDRIGMFALGAGVGISVTAKELLAVFCTERCHVGPAAVAITQLESLAIGAVVGGVVCVVTAAVASGVLD